MLCTGHQSPPPRQSHSATNFRRNYSRRQAVDSIYWLSTWLRRYLGRIRRGAVLDALSAFGAL